MSDSEFLYDLLGQLSKHLNENGDACGYFSISKADQERLALIAQELESKA